MFDLETLEPRCLLDCVAGSLIADFYGAGIAVDNGVYVYDVAGDACGTHPEEITNFDAIFERDNSVERLTSSGAGVETYGPGGVWGGRMDFNDFTVGRGGRFDGANGYSNAGWAILEDYFDDDLEDGSFSIVTEPSAETDPAALVGNWVATSIYYDSQSPVFGQTGGITITNVESATHAQFDFVGEGIPDQRAHNVSAAGSPGRFALQDSTKLTLSKDGSILIGVDIHLSGDNRANVFVATRANGRANADWLAGTWWFALTSGTGGMNSALLDAEGVGDPLEVTLHRDGTMTATYVPDDFSEGEEHHTGVWSIANGIVTFEFHSQPLTATGAVSYNGRNIVPLTLQNRDTGHQVPIFGIGVRTDDLAPTNLSLSSNGTAAAEYYELRSDRTWHATSLAGAIGTAQTRPSIGTLDLVDPATGRRIVVTNTDSELIVYEQQDDRESWTARNLVTDLGAPVITSELTPFSATAAEYNGQFIAGFTAGRELVLLNLRPDAGGGERWSVENLGATFSGMAVPAFTSAPVSFTTSWNALNVGGLDEDGAIWVVWWAPGTGVWQMSNLSGLTEEAPPLASISPFVTDWDAQNLVGVDAAGNVVTTWWAPQTGIWQTSDLTAIASGPAVLTTAITSYIPFWPAQNIAAIDTDGNLVAYWWSPTSGGWNVDQLAAADDLPETIDRLSSTTTEGAGGLLSIQAWDGVDLTNTRWSLESPLWVVEDVPGI